MFLPELGLPFDEGLARAKEIGADSVWFTSIADEPPIAEMSDAEAGRMAARVAKHGLELHVIAAGAPFKQLHLADLDLDTMQDDPAFRKEFDDLVRSMQIAVHLGIKTVNTFTFAWPGEYGAGKPTWPMRWLTRGGVIADVDMEKLLKAFSLVAQEAEHYDVDVSLSMMPWNYTNTTGNFRRVAEAVGSSRLKVMWGPADNYNSGEWDVATAGFNNIRPYLHGLHLKDLHVMDGLNLKFEYRPLGDGDVDYPEVLRRMQDHRSDAVLSLATHFIPPGGTRIDAMRINYQRLTDMIRKVQAGARSSQEEAKA
jgi:sugar phosphate isomerase/epimerase